MKDNTYNDALRVFLSYAKEDKETARGIYESLVSQNVQVWFDEESLLPGQEWRLEIERAINNADVVIICCSQESIGKNGFINKEIKIALEKSEEKAEGSIFIIPARIEECIVPERLSKWQWVDLFTANGHEKLLKTLKSVADTLKKPLPRIHVPSRLASLAASSLNKAQQ